MNLQSPKNIVSINSQSRSGGPSRERIWLMFDRIAARYDLLNHLLSFGFDRHWRKKLARFLPAGENLCLLDLATGTGDQLISILTEHDNIKQAVGSDLSVKMLEIAAKKIAKHGLNSIIKLITAGADKINFPDHTFDVITVSFGIRNFSNLEHSLNEMRRVLKPGGNLLILEFSLPGNKMIQKLYLFYLRKIIPLIGSWISGDEFAYRYLNETIETFPGGEMFCSLLTRAGFNNARITTLTGGIVMIYQGEK
jgi:demethylmenaquinone methyltransferase/2-methoxy-6-polyprenyl-1,4-benzoquinol methylase